MSTAGSPGFRKWSLAPSLGARSGPLDVEKLTEICERPENLDSALTMVREEIRTEPKSAMPLCRVLLDAAVRAGRVVIAEKTFMLIKDSMGANRDVPATESLGYLGLLISCGMAAKLYATLSSLVSPLTIAEILTLWKTPLLVRGTSPAVMSTLCGLIMRIPLPLLESSEVDLLNVIMVDLVQASMIRQVRELFEYVTGLPAVWGQKRKMLLKRGVVHKILDLFIGVKEFAVAHNVMRYMLHSDMLISESSFVKLFIGVLNGTNDDLALEVFQTAKAKLSSDSVEIDFYRDALEPAVKMGRPELAIAMVEYLGTCKIIPRSWDSMIPVMRLAVAWDKLETFALALNNFFVQGNTTVPIDLPAAFVSELIAHCVTHKSYSHAVWYHKYMVHNGLRRSPTDFQNLFRALTEDSGCADEAGNIFNDAKKNRYIPSPEDVVTIVNALIVSKPLNWMKMAAECLDAIKNKELLSRLKPTGLLELMVYMERPADAFEVFERCYAGPSYTGQNSSTAGTPPSPTEMWPEKFLMTEDSISRFINMAANHNRFEMAENLVYLLRKGGRQPVKPSRGFIHKILHDVDSLDTPDVNRKISLGIRLFGWGVETGACGLIRFRDLVSDSKIHAEDCWSFLETRLHILRVVEWMRLEMAKSIVRSEIKVMLPLFFNRPKSNTRVSGSALATEIAAMLRTDYGVRLEVRMVAEADEKERRVLIIPKQSLLDFMHEVFGPGPEVGSVYVAVPELKNKNLEGGSLIFGSPVITNRLCAPDVDPREGIAAVPFYARTDRDREYNNRPDFQQQQQQQRDYRTDQQQQRDYNRPDMQQQQQQQRDYNRPESQVMRDHREPVMRDPRDVRDMREPMGVRDVYREAPMRDPRERDVRDVLVSGGGQRMDIRDRVDYERSGPMGTGLNGSVD
ncbi:hypothetical protein HDU76_008099, partial [Blyttiomyces sp. JEL0837]